MAKPSDEEIYSETVFAKLESVHAIENLIYVRYLDHVMYNRSSALMMQPQTREAIGWLIYENEKYIIISWDRDAEPPTLHGGDPKASGMVLLKSDIIIQQKLNLYQQQLQKSSNWNLNCQPPKQEAEYALRRPSKRKTPGAKADSEKTTGEKTT